MNNIVLSPNIASLINPGFYEVTDEVVLSHLTNFLGLNPGAKRDLKIIIPNKGRGMGEFELNESGKVYVRITELYTTKNRNVHLAIASARPPMVKRILEHATTLGAASFHFFSADLSEKSYFSSKVYENDQAQKFIEKGMAQCGQFSTYPAFSKHQKLEDVITFFSSLNVKQFWLDKDEKKFFDDDASSKEVCLYIGPERGWSKRELEVFESSNVLGVKLSDSVMRVEFAINAAFAQLEYISNRR